MTPEEFIPLEIDADRGYPDSRGPLALPRRPAGEVRPLRRSAS